LVHDHADTRFEHQVLMILQKGLVVLGSVVSIKYNQDCHDIGAQTITDPPMLHSEDWPPGI